MSNRGEFKALELRAFAKLKQRDAEPKSLEKYNRKLRQDAKLAEREFRSLGKAVQVIQAGKLTAKKLGVLDRRLVATVTLVHNRGWFDRLIENRTGVAKYLAGDSEETIPIELDQLADELRLASLICDSEASKLKSDRKNRLKGIRTGWRKVPSLVETAQGLWFVLQFKMRPADSRFLRDQQPKTKGNDPPELVEFQLLSGMLPDGKKHYLDAVKCACDKTKTWPQVENETKISRGTIVVWAKKAKIQLPKRPKGKR